MVIGQIAGIGTAFGTGELSGAGFGPNYTILMKIGYEFYAPRIIEEMHKNPKMHFQDTVYWKQFQVSIKLYSDQVIKETLQTLLDIPDATIAAIDRKLSGRTAEETTPIQQVSHILQQSNELEIPPGETTVTEGGQRYHIRGTPMFLTFNIMPNIEKLLSTQLGKFGNTTSMQSQALPTAQEFRTEQSASGLSLSLFDLRKWRFTDLNNAMSAITRGNSPYSSTTQQRIRTEWIKVRKEATTKATNAQKRLLEKQSKTNIEINEIIRTTPGRGPLGAKRPAGQSVKLERNRLIKEIAKWGQRVSSHKKAGIGSRLRPAVVAGAIHQLQKNQKLLATLLSRYTF